MLQMLLVSECSASTSQCAAWKYIDIRYEDMAFEQFSALYSIVVQFKSAGDRVVAVLCTG